MSITAKARTAGVIGWPVSHSKSPRLHGYWLDKYEVDGAYIPLPLHPDHLEDGIRALSYLGFRGANVTIPHKENAFTLCDRTSAAARQMKAVNTLIFQGDEIYGDNTDGPGFLANLRASIPHWQASRGPALVVGAGGAARAICYSLLEAGVPEIHLVNRTKKRASALARDLGGAMTVHDWSAREDLLSDIALLVNASSLGMEGSDIMDLSLQTLAPGAIVCDVVYTPLETPLLKEARARGNPTVDGLGMLLYQAVPGFEAWFGIAPEVDIDLRARILQKT